MTAVTTPHTSGLGRPTAQKVRPTTRPWLTEVAAYARSNEKAAIQVIPFPAKEDTVSPRSLGRPELEAYYEKHKSEFRSDDEASLMLVVAPKTTSQADVQSAGENARSLYREAVKDSDFVKFLQETP